MPAAIRHLVATGLLLTTQPMPISSSGFFHFIEFILQRLLESVLDLGSLSQIIIGLNAIPECKVRQQKRQERRVWRLNNGPFKQLEQTIPPVKQESAQY
jgi:hypothetical protein